MAVPKLIYESNELLVSSFKSFGYCTLLSALEGRIFSIPFSRNPSRFAVIHDLRPCRRTAILIGYHSYIITIVLATCFPALNFLTNYVTIVVLKC